MAIRRRTVTGNIQKANAPWPDARVTFRLLGRGSFNADAQFPGEAVHVLTDEQGDFSIDLWCDEDALTATQYGCWLPDEPYKNGRSPAFRFDLAYGDGSDISLETIRETEIVPYTPSNAAALQGVITGLADHVETVLDHEDVPDSYEGQAGKVLKVNAEATALEFAEDSGGVTDHGALTGLSDDDHTQYLNNARGDARYPLLSDPRLTDSRTPTGGAGGVLAGDFPDPGFAVNMATQAELNTETAGRLAGDLAAVQRSNHTGTQAISTVAGLQAALDLKAPLASPTFTGTPAAPTPLTADVSTRIATTAYVDARITALINLAPSALDTFGEIAAQMAVDQSGVAALTATVAGKQAAHANLTALSGFTLAADKLPYATGVGALALADITPFGRSIIDDVDAATVRTTLGLVPGTNVQAYSAQLLTIAGLSPSNDDILQRKAGAWTSRTPAQLKIDLAIVSGDVSGLGTMATQAEMNYALLAGRAGGQTINGGTGSGEHLTLNSTSHATKGKIFVGANSAYDQVNDRLGINTTAPTYRIHLPAAANTANQAFIAGTIFGTDGNGSTLSPSSSSFSVFAGGGSMYFASGKVAINGSGVVTVPGAQLHVVAGAAGTISGIFDTAASPSAKILDLRINGTSTSYFDSSGNLFTPALLTTTTGVRINSAGLSLIDSGRLLFYNAANFNSSDASISRQGIGVLQIGDGGANANGKLNCAEYRVAGNAVVIGRKTGWTLPTSTKTRTNADYSALTLAQLAEVVAALVNDVHSAGGSHGLLTT